MADIRAQALASSSAILALGRKAVPLKRMRSSQKRAMQNGDSDKQTNRFAADMGKAARKGPAVPQPLIDSFRNVRFFARATSLFTAYEMFKIRNRVLSTLRRDSRDQIEAAWAKQHDWGGRQLYKIAVDLQGFHLKGAQWLSARPDICPMQWIVYLARLQDRCPPLRRDEVEAVVESELGASIEDLFSKWDDKPIGSASIAQVHRAWLRKKGFWRWRRHRKVAVKVQREGAEHTMLCDLRSLQRFFSIPYVRRSLAWDPKVVIDLVYNETSAEFDFVHEAEAMDGAAKMLRRPSSWLRRLAFYKPPVSVPQSIPGMVTKRLLVMDMLSGEALASIARKAEQAPAAQSSKLARRAKKSFAKTMLSQLSDAYGRMLFEDGFGGVHADPHPGNILLSRDFGKLNIGLVDWGQIKRFDLAMRLRVARMVEALCAAGDDAGRASSEDLLTAFRVLGVRWNSSRPWEEQRAAVAATATEWFDTVPLPQPYTIDPTSTNYPILTLEDVDMAAFPTDLLYLFRTTQYLRAMGDKLDVQWSLAQRWRPHARRLLRQHRLL